MKSKKRTYLLQLFAQDAAGEAAAESADAGENSEAADTVSEAAETAETEKETDLSAEFDELIKCRFREQYAERVQKIIDKRFRKAKEDEARLEKLLAETSGGEKADGTREADGEEQPEDEKLSEFKKKNEQLKARKNQFAAWMTQSERLREKYPAFDFAAQVKGNPAFTELLNAGASVETAFKTANFDSFMREARDCAAREAKAAMVSSVRSNGIRPVENGMESGAPAVRSTSPDSLSLGEINDLFARAGRGEKITFR